MAISTGISNKSYISAISLLDKREILKQAVDVQNEEGLTDVLGLLGRQKSSTEAIYHDYTEDPLYQLLDTTGATVTGSGTASVTTTFTVATSGFVVKGDLILFPTGDKVGQVQSVTTASSQDTVVIKSIDGTNITHTAAQLLSPISNMVGENSTAPTNRKYGWTKYANNIMTFRGVNEITDVQDASAIELEFDGKPYVFDRDIANKFIKFKGDINQALIASVKSTALYSDTSNSLLDPVGGGNQQSTMGLNQYVVTYGVNGVVATPGTAIMSDFETFFNSLTAARAPHEYMAWSSTAVMMKVDNCFKALGSSGFFSAKLQVDGKDIDFDINKVTYGGYTVQFGVLPILNHPVAFSQSSIVKNLYFIPTGKVATKSGGTEDRISIRYMPRKEKGLGNEIYQEWDNGAMARGGAIGDGSFRRTNWISSQGLQCLGVQQFGKLKVLA